MLASKNNRCLSSSTVLSRLFMRLFKLVAEIGVERNPTKPVFDARGGMACHHAFTCKTEVGVLVQVPFDNFLCC